MSLRRAARVDRNQPEVVAGLRRLGWYVLIISQLKNCCDLMASKNGFSIAIEVKDGEKPPSERKLTKGESDFFDSWKGESAIIYSLDDAKALDDIISKRAPIPNLMRLWQADSRQE